ncbi:MAG TPA: SDR family oxidoreductase [Ottowia sp.]|uniref:SDR family oxidoreductase n=1 Tax=Ottowia sp. TaxID=1898956 RepID=UPI002CAA9B81|nr:SDR family oxidoreductase [Ottowia sp.]HMN21776.1 SDR family oxidoreductase [Ottowia sp.]
MSPPPNLAPGDAAPLVFITGASSGIGQALAARYAAAGWRLALVARRGPLLQAWIEAQGLPPERCLVQAADVADVDAMVAVARACVERLGVPDVVIANAGISIGMDSAERADLDIMARTFATNNLGLAATFHPFIEPMRRRGSGRLVGIASVAAMRGLPGHGAYCASKAAVVAYCESLRGELRGSGVRVVTLLPGWVDTPLTRGNRYPMPFILTPEAFAERAQRAIESGASWRVIPWPMALVARVLRLLPNRLFDRLLAGRPRKARASGH